MKSSNDIDRDCARRLRQKERKHYTEDCINDEEIEGKRMFSVEEKLGSDNYNGNFVQEMKGDEVCLRYFQENGFEYPIVIKDRTGLGMRLPSKNFTVNDVRQCVGSRRVLDVMDVTTQKDIEMTMKEWVKYFENPQRDKLLNVISLEFSHTKLESYIESPKLVREIDWVDTVWPTHLKQSQTESTNIIEDMKYPKVQKYCLMSVKGCYTDFHIDFGGTSVWYHILHGRKVFWLIPPTETNIQLYEQWVLSGKQGDVFFGDTVDECGRIELEDGWTFFIPTGWIHAVYTPQDSLVFGGNFLHSFGIEKQLRIAQVEDTTRVPTKFRYPFYTEMLWYVLARYVECLLGRSHLEEPDDVKSNQSREEAVVEDSCHENGAIITPPDSPQKPNGVQAAVVPYPVVSSPVLKEVSTKCTEPCEEFKDDQNDGDDTEGKENRWIPSSPAVEPATDSLNMGNGSHNGDEDSAPNSPPSHVHLTRYEINGIKAIIRWLANLSVNKRNVPDQIKNPAALLGDVKILLEQHVNDDSKLAITGKSVLVWPELPKRQRLVKQVKSGAVQSRTPSSKLSSSKGNSSARRRRTRCKKCEACLRADCGECHFCKDMKKFGGPGRMKQSCIGRQCMAPVLPHTACCMVCGKDGWEKDAEASEEEASSLMECSICWEIVHPECLSSKWNTFQDDGSVSDDLPNSWECPKCCQTANGKGGPIPKLRQIKPHRLRSNEGTPSSLPGTQQATTATTTSKRPKEESECEDEQQLSPNVGSGFSIVSQKRKEPSSAVKVAWKKRKIPEVKSKKQQQLPDDHLPAEVQKIKNDGESHVRSCIRQPVPVHPFRDLMSTTTNEELEERGLQDGPKTEDEPKPIIQSKYTPNVKPKPTTPHMSRILDPNDKHCLRELMNCQIKVLKCDDEIVEGSTAKVSLTPPPASSLCSVLGTTAIRTNPSRPASKLQPRLVDGKGKVLRKPVCVVRPAPILESKERGKLSPGCDRNLALEKDCVAPVFRYLSTLDLCRCMRVCRTWNAWCLDRRLWSRLDLNHHKISAQHLAGIVRRQPAHLGLGWTNISKKLLGWLLARSPQLRTLDLGGNLWSTVLALASCNCPVLQGLDLTFVVGMTDAHLRELLSPPPDSRPGLLESRSRLRNLTELKLSGCDISDVSLRYVTQYLHFLAKLDVSRCTKVTDAGIALLTANGSPVKDTLTHLDVSGCKRLTDNCMEHLRRCSGLVLVDLRNCPEVSITACRKFIAQSKQPLMMIESKLIEKQQVNYPHRTFQNL